MKKHTYCIFTYGFALMLFAVQSPMAFAAQGDVGVVEGRVVNVKDPIDGQDAATKKYVDNLIDGIPDPAAVLQSTGKSETAIMSQSAVTTAINAAQDALSSQLNENGIPVVTTTGTASALVATVPDWDVTVGKMMVIIPHVTGASNAVTLNVNNDGAKTFTCTDSSGANGDFASSAPVVTAGTPVLIARGATQWNVLNISKPNVNSVNGVLPISNGGTGATTLSAAQTALGIPSFPLSIANGGTGSSTNTSAVSNLGFAHTSGSWTPLIHNDSGTNPTYTTEYSYGYYRTYNYGSFKLTFITFRVKFNISNVGNTSAYARIDGLPTTAADVGDQSIACSEAVNVATSGVSNTVNGIYQVLGSSSSIRVACGDGGWAVKWNTGTTYTSGSGWYISV